MSLTEDISVSVIIPCYNAELYIGDTIDSIIKQSVENIEIIVVNDGSKDRSVQIIESIGDLRVKTIHQENIGVSLARNNGLAVAKGDFIIFFDADDIMSENFIKVRVEELKHDLELDFVCAKIFTFKKYGEFISEDLEGPVNNMEEKILMFHKNIHTCPSNYMFRKISLQRNNIVFNPILASPADRFFLLEVAKKRLKGKLLNKGGELLYRINDNSMSHYLTEGLVKNTELYYSELLRKNIIPLEIKNKALAKGYFIISGSNFKLKNLFLTIKYALMSFFYSPIIFIRNLF